MSRVALGVFLIALGIHPALARGGDGYGNRFRPPAFLSPKPSGENSAPGSSQKPHSDAAPQAPADSNATQNEWWRKGNSNVTRSDRARAAH
jgi:hypothetical protein